MRGHEVVLNGGHEGTTVFITVIEVGACLVIVFHEIGERKIAKAILDELARRSEHPAIPCALFSRDVKAGSVVPTIMVSVIIDVPWVEWIGSPMIDCGDIVHAKCCIAIFPAVGNAIAVRIWMGRVSNSS